MTVRTERHPGQVLVVLDTGNPHRSPRIGEVIDPQPAPTIDTADAAGGGESVAVRAERDRGGAQVVVDTGNPHRSPRVGEVIDPQPTTATAVANSGEGMAVRAERDRGEVLVVVDTGNPHRSPRVGEVIDPQPTTATAVANSGEGMAVRAERDRGEVLVVLDTGDPRGGDEHGGEAGTGLERGGEVFRGKIEFESLGRITAAELLCLDKEPPGSSEPLLPQCFLALRAGGHPFDRRGGTPRCHQ